MRSLYFDHHSSKCLTSLTDHNGYKELPTASYRILLFSWAIYCFLVSNSFSGCILAFMNVRLYDAAIDTVAALEDALQREIYTGGTLRDSFMLGMIKVSEVCHFPRENSQARRMLRSLESVASRTRLISLGNGNVYEFREGPERPDLPLSLERETH